jgi:hypothetical protein
MVNYQSGKIYRIDGGGLTYIGSTTKNYLCDRLALHKSDYNRFLIGKRNYITSFEILKTDNYRIELIESFPCDSKDELTAREGHFIRTMDCVNNQIAGRTKKEYYQDNKNEISQRHKQYYQDNKEKQQKRHECECGGKYTHANKSIHLKTKKHQNYLKGIKE